MPMEDPTGRVRQWFMEGGWRPERNVAAEIQEKIDWRVSESDRQGHTLRPHQKAVDFLAAFGLLRLARRTSTREIVLSPASGYDDDAEDIIELSENVGEPLFPVGYETEELGMVLLGDNGRFFYLHESGPYYLGQGLNEAFDNLLSITLEDAENYFV